jgi:hypothetical protein
VNVTLRIVYLIALLLAWLGYFSPWVWPAPGALRLSAHDLVEWMTFVQTVRDGTYRVTRLDLLWPLAGIALLSALSVPVFQRPDPPSARRPLAVVWLALALLAAFLILPAYPFVLTAYRDPELAPQFWLGTVCAVAAAAAWAVALRRPAWAAWPAPFISALALAASIRAVWIDRPPIADMLTLPVPIGYGWVLTAAGLGTLTLLWGVELGRRLRNRHG